MPLRVSGWGEWPILLVDMTTRKDMCGGEGCRGIDSVKEEDAVGRRNEKYAANSNQKISLGYYGDFGGRINTLS